MKQTHVDPLYLSAAREIEKVLKAQGIADADAIRIAGEFSTPPNIQLGHLAFPTFQYAKLVGKKPPEFAGELAAALASGGFFQDAKAAGPYLNLFVSPRTLGEQAVIPALTGAAFKIPQLAINPVMVEYSQPNTHKELHVGHMRNLCMGNALVRLLRMSGRPVVATTFPGDVGTHVAKCLWYLYYKVKYKQPGQTEKPDETKKGQWLGQLYSRAHNLLEDEKGTPAEEVSRQQMTEILQQLEAKKGPFYDLWKETRQWSVDQMHQLYAWADVTFDVEYWESDVDSASVAWVKELYKEGKVQESQGAIGVDLEDQKLGFCMLLKSDGNGLYATKDLELAKRKFSKYNPSQSIYVVDLRQELHFKQVFAVFKKIGFPTEADRCFHLKYNFVELPDGAMSSRKGNIVPIMDLINNMKTHVIETYLKRYEHEWDQQYIRDVADMVAEGAIKYGMNVMDPNKKIVFKMEDWLKLDGESGPYIQYSHARICSLLEKLSDIELEGAVKYELLTEPIEVELMIKLAQFSKVIETSAQALKTSTVCAYLYDTAKLFNSFYHDCPIGKLENKDHQKARLTLAKAAGAVLKQGLGVLGIPAPSKM